MMKRSPFRFDPLLVFLLFPLLASLAFLISCSRTPAINSTSSYQPPLTAYLEPRPDSKGLQVPWVRITVPINRLVFSHQGDVLQGGLEVVVVATRAGVQVGGGVAQKIVQLTQWSDTESDSLLTMSVRVPLTTDREVDLEIRARSLGTTRTWVRHISCHPDQWRRLPLAFSKWHWNAQNSGLAPTDGDSLLVDLVVERLAGSLWPTDPLAVGLRVTGPEGFVRDRRQRIAWVDSFTSTRTIHFTVPISELPFGRCEALAQLIIGSGPGERTNSWPPGHQLLVTRIDFGDDQAWARQLEWLKGLVPPQKLGDLAQLQPNARVDAWTGLWSQYSGGSDQGSELQDHLLQILAADLRFGGPERGSLTDRGRAWVRYGKPDQIEHKGNQQGIYRRWEVWHYRKEELVLTFLDSHGLGEYRLLETEHLPD